MHVYYWEQVWQPHGWKLVHRYKKHLPKDERMQVERMLDHVFLGGVDGGLEAALAALLARIWTADDWSAAVRDPRLAIDAGLEGAALDAWHAQLATLPS